MSWCCVVAAALLALTSEPDGIPASVNGTAVGSTPLVVELPDDDPVRVHLASRGNPMFIDVVFPGDGDLTVHANAKTRRVAETPWIDARLVVRFEQGEWGEQSDKKVKGWVTRALKHARKGKYGKARRVCEKIETAEPGRLYCDGIVRAVHYLDTYAGDVGADACSSLEGYLWRAPEGRFAREARNAVYEMNRGGYICETRTKRRADGLFSFVRDAPRRTDKSQTPRERARSLVELGAHAYSIGDNEKAILYAQRAVNFDRSYGEAYCAHVLWSQPYHKRGYIKKCLELAPRSSKRRHTVKRR